MDRIQRDHMEMSDESSGIFVKQSREIARLCSQINFGSVQIDELIILTVW